MKQWDVPSIGQMNSTGGGSAARLDAKQRIRHTAQCHHIRISLAVSGSVCLWELVHAIDEENPQQ